jgi:hypothetical protein
MLPDFTRAEWCIDEALKLEPNNEACLKLKAKILHFKPIIEPMQFGRTDHLPDVIAQSGLKLLVTNEEGVTKEIKTTDTTFSMIKKDIAKAFYPDARKIRMLKKMPEGTVLSSTEELKGKPNNFI